MLSALRRDLIRKITVDNSGIRYKWGASTSCSVNRPLLRTLLSAQSSERCIMGHSVIDREWKSRCKRCSGNVSSGSALPSRIALLAAVKESDGIRPGVIADFGYDDRIFGFQVLNASSVVEQTRELQFAVAD